MNSGMYYYHMLNPQACTETLSPSCHEDDDDVQVLLHMIVSLKYNWHAIEIQSLLLLLEKLHRKIVKSSLSC